MKSGTYLAVISILILTVGESRASSELDMVQRVQGMLKATAIRVVCKPKGTFATGFLSKIEGSDQHLLFISNRHVFEDGKSLQLSIPAYDSFSNIINSYEISVDLFDDSGRSLFLVPDDSLDIAVTIISKKQFGKKGERYFSSLLFDLYADSPSLQAGQEVNIFGYPLGIAVNKYSPLMRKGIIAGIDTLKKIIYVDANIFPGSSGSPVFLDLSTQTNIDYYKKHSAKVFVGIVSGYLPFTKQLENTQTRKIEMIQTENSGLGIVIPAEKVKELGYIALQKLKKR